MAVTPWGESARAAGAAPLHQPRELAPVPGDTEVAGSTGAGSAGPCEGQMWIGPFPRRFLGGSRPARGLLGLVGWGPLMGGEGEAGKGDVMWKGHAARPRHGSWGMAPGLLHPGLGVQPQWGWPQVGLWEPQVPVRSLGWGTPSGAGSPMASTDLPASMSLPWVQRGVGGLWSWGHVCRPGPWLVPAGEAVAGEALPGPTVRGAGLEITRKFNLPMACSVIALLGEPGPPQLPCKRRGACCAVPVCTPLCPPSLHGPAPCTPGVGAVGAPLGVQLPVLPPSSGHARAEAARPARDMWWGARSLHAPWCGVPLPPALPDPPVRAWGWGELPPPQTPASALDPRSGAPHLHLRSDWPRCPV